MITRRGLFGILAGAVAAPVVVRSGLLMPVKALVMPEPKHFIVAAVMNGKARLLPSEIDDLSRRIMADIKVTGPASLRIDEFEICGVHGFQVGDIIRCSS